ncbi:MAG: hypothetical protein NTW38_09335 [Candidatus Aminicenantes bacterium]|nr:hypothetical protein [Candidatus Aminicenantes bacterium]
MSPAKFFWGAVHIFILAFAVWLVSPLIVITASDYLFKNSYGLRLALGLLIFIMYVGKWSFDVFAPQGLARKVSRLKTAALIIYILVVVSFMIYIVAQAASLFLQSAVKEAESDQSQIQTRVQPAENRIPDGFAVYI